MEKKKMKSNDIRIFEEEIDVIEIIKNITANLTIENRNSFFIINLDEAYKKDSEWKAKIPRADAFYAVKCNDDPMLLRLLASLGRGFDCASGKEMEMILELGVPPERIIFANSWKQASWLKYAYEVGVDLMTFDHELELHKIKKYHPRAKCVLRIKTNDKDAVWALSSKFGADIPTACKLIDTAVELNVELVGIAFHAGTYQSSYLPYKQAIQHARELFNFARDKHKIEMYLLDIGGGFLGSFHSRDVFNCIANEINQSLDEHFPQDLFPKLKIISEPGTYFALSPYTLCTNVIGKRCLDQSEQELDKNLDYLREIEKEWSFTSDFQPYHVDLSRDHSLLDSTKKMQYYVNEGKYSSLGFCTTESTPILLKDYPPKRNNAKLYNSIIFGLTCDSTDVIVDQLYLPEVNIDDWMVFKNRGAYSLTLSTEFNGLPFAKQIYVFFKSAKSWETMKKIFLLSE